MKLMNNLVRQSLIVAMIPLALLSSCKLSQKSAITSKPTQTIHAVGYIEPRGELRRLAFQGHGVIVRIGHQIGDQVKAGDILASLDDRLERSQLLTASAELAMAEANRDLALAGAHPEAIHVAEAMCRAAKVEMKHRANERIRLEGLRDKRTVSDLDLKAAVFDAENSAAKAQSAVASLAHLRNQVRPEDRLFLESQVMAARAAVESAKARVNQMMMLAPSNGTIIEIFRREGEAVSISFSEPVILFAPEGALEVRAEVDEQFLSKIKKGDAANIHSRSGLEPMKGVVREIKPVMGRKTVFAREATERMDLQILEVRIEFADPPVWPIGAEVDVDIEPK